MPKKGSPYSTRLEVLHRHWLADILGMTTNGYEGIDLFDSSTDRDLEERLFAIEAKCKLLQRGYSTSSSVKDSQYTGFPNLHKDKELFWAFVYYRLSSTIKSIVEQTEGKPDFSQFITARDVYFQPWSFMAQFQPNPRKLETWRYAERDKVIEGEHTKIEVVGGTLYFPPDCSLIQRLQSANLPELVDIPF